MRRDRQSPIGRLMGFPTFGGLDKDEMGTMTHLSALPNENPCMLCEAVGIDAAEIEKRRRFQNFTAADEENLDAIQSIIAATVDEIIVEFYDHLGSFEDVAHYLQDERTLSRLKEAQRRYLLSVGREPGLAYFEGRLQIGLAHERVALPQKTYLGANLFLIDCIAKRIGNRHKGDADVLASILLTLNRIFTQDAILVVEAYHHVAIDRLTTTVGQLEETQEQLRLLATTDALTNVNNRKRLVDLLTAEFKRSRRFGRAFALLFLDLDHFKEINDNYGHAFGDHLLRTTVQSMRKALRAEDILGRYGGEEFLIGLVETAPAAAQEIAERIRSRIADTPIEFMGRRVSATVSIGTVSLNSGIQDLQEMIEHADRAMYQAKQAGRNRIFASVPSDSEQTN